jgi:uncharacterized membrane protein YuzA (DUF378 family)
MDKIETNAMALYKSKYFHLVNVFLVLVGGLNWLSVLFMKKDAVSSLFGTKSFLTQAIYLLVGVSAVLLFFNRDSYLPFLGESIIPCATIATRVPDNANTDVTMTVPPNTKVIYWAAEPKDASNNTVNTWDKAYMDYSNSGVAVSDAKGIVLLRIRGPPQAYTVPMKGQIKPHIHFRLCEKNGMVGHVQTYFMGDGTIEKFKNYF